MKQLETCRQSDGIQGIYNCFSVLPFIMEIFVPNKCFAASCMGLYCFPLSFYGVLGVNGLIAYPKEAIIG